MLTNLLFCECYLLVDAFCIVVVVIIASQMNRNSGSESQVRLFFFFLTAYLVYLITDAIWAFMIFSGYVQPSYIVVGIVTLINRVAIATAGYCWFLYSLLRFGSKRYSNMSFRAISALPIVIVAVMYIIGIATNWDVIALDPNNQQSGMDYFIVSALAFLYLIAATIEALYAYKRATTSSERSISLIFMAFMIAPACAAIINLFEPNLPGIALGILVSVLVVHLSLQRTRIYNDELTGLNNRRRANAYLEESIAHSTSEHPVYLFIIDMNRFKQINDTYGHLEGDHALKIMAEALRRSSQSLNAFAARWGGDEFMLICAHGPSTDPKSVVKTVDSTLSGIIESSDVSYDLTCSIGFAECVSPNTMVSDLISEADEMLYSIKGSSSRA